MKKISLIVILVSIYSFTNAQVYIKALTGYSFSSNPKVQQSVEIVNYNKNVYVSKLKNGSGLNLGLALGHSISNNFSLELVGNTQVFTAQHLSVPQYDLSMLFNNAGGFSYSSMGYFGNAKYTNSMFQLSPQIVYNIKYKKNSFYIKAGPNFMVVKNNCIYSYLDGWSLKPIVEEINTRGGISIGIQSSLGTQYLIAEGISIFAEFLSVNTNYKFKEQETTRYDVDGKSHLSDFEPGYQSMDNDQKIDFSHFGFNIGIIYGFKKR